MKLAELQNFSERQDRVLLQNTRILHVKIEVLNNHDIITGEVSGEVVSGSYTISALAAIRRTASVTLRLQESFLPDADTVFWINRKFRLYLGIEEADSGEIIWFPKGTYAIQDPSIDVTLEGNTMTISGLDKMALYTGDISGYLADAYLIEIDPEKEPVTIREAVEAIMKDSGESDMHLILANEKDENMCIPYKIESAVGDTRYTLLETLTNLFYNYQCYFDIDGTFVFAPKPTFELENYPVQWDFRAHNLLISVQRNILYSNVKNKITVYGAVHDDGYQPKYEIIVDEAHYPHSPFTVEKLDEYVRFDPATGTGVRMYRDYVTQEDSYVSAVREFQGGSAYRADDIVLSKGKHYRCLTDIPAGSYFSPETETAYWQFIDTGMNEDGEIIDHETYEAAMAVIHAAAIDLCQSKALEEVYNHQQATDTINCTCLPIYSLDVNSVILLDDPVSGASGKYVVTEISCGLGAGEIMNFTANKLWKDVT